MKRLLRLGVFMIAISLYINMIDLSDNMIRNIMKIMLITLLLIGMESVRRKGDNLYLKNADITVIDEMSDATFREYIAQLYKKLDYYIQPNTTAKGKYDFLIRKDRKFSFIKCLKYDKRINLEEAIEIVQAMDKLKSEKLLLVTNQMFEQEAITYLEQHNIQYVERRYLIALIEQTINEEHIGHRTRKVQET